MPIIVKSPIENITPYVVIKDGNHRKYSDTISPSTLEIDLDNQKSTEIDVSKRLYYQDYTIDLTSKDKTKLYSSPVVVSLHSSKYSWSKELPFCDIVTNDDGLYCIFNDRIAKLDITNGNFAWEYRYSEFLNGTTGQLKYFICNTYIIIRTRKNNFIHINTIDGKLTDIDIKILNYDIVTDSSGFVYDNEFYYVDEKYDIIKYPHIPIMNIKDKLKVSNSYYISLYKNSVIMQTFTYPLLVWNTDISDNFSIYTLNNDLLTNVMFPEGKVDVYTISGGEAVDLNKNLNNDKLSTIIVDDFILAYSSKKVTCYDDYWNIRWEFTSIDKEISYNDFDVIWIDNEKVVVKTEKEIVCYEIPK